MKTYTIPSLVARGNAAIETLGGISGPVEASTELNRKPRASIGSVGYYL